MNQYRILVVDDEKMMRSLIQRSLSDAGCKVLTAGSAEEGMALMEVNNIDLVISDQKMPGGMTGIDFLQYIRTAYPEVLTILLTGYPNLETAMDAINSAGVLKYLTKPFEIRELTRAVKHCFEVKDLVTERNLMMNKIKSYESRLEELEKEHPGITHVVRDKNGHIITDI